MEVVHRTGGHIASERSLAGIMEILGAYEAGQVRSELPPGLQELREEGNPVRLPHHASGVRSGMTGFLLFMGVLYTTLLVLANFGLLGPLGPVIMRPYQALVIKIQQFITHL
jgi:hypothetical protein